LATLTKNGAVKEPKNAGGTPLNDLLKEYVRRLDQEVKQKAQPEIAKFIRWVGGERAASSLSPAEVGEYSDTFGARATTIEAAERLGAVKDFLSYIRKEGHSEVNLSQHLRLRKSRSSSGKGGSVAGRTQAIRLTRAGYNDLTKRLAQLQEDRVRLAAEIHRAAADKDVRENAPLEAARENQGMVVARMREIETTLKQSVVLDDNGDDRSRVRIGSKVTLKDKASDRSVSYQLVEPNEASPLSGKISVVSPVGTAILGRAAGDQVNVKTPSGPHVYIIEKTS
jgi:transcription elongation factor GreA